MKGLSPQAYAAQCSSDKIQNSHTKDKQKNPSHSSHLFLLHRYDDGWIAALHEHEVHQQATGASVPVVERVNVDEAIVGEGGQLEGVEGERILRVEPVDKLGDEARHVGRRRRDKVADKNLKKLGKF